MMIVPKQTTSKTASPQSAALDEVDTGLLYEAPVTPVDASFGQVKANVSRTMPVRAMIDMEQKRGLSDVTIVFAVRHVACASCRERALQIVRLANAVGAISVAVVKETGVNDEALLTFHRDFFAHGLLYRDDRLQIYEAMGGRRLSVLTMLGRWQSFRAGVKAKGIKSHPEAANG
jgi:hypothetical protein